MKNLATAFLAASTILIAGDILSGAPGTAARYRYAGSAHPVVAQFEIAFGPNSWLSIRASKQDGSSYRLWIQSTKRYLLAEGGGVAREYRHAASGAAVLPSALNIGGLLPTSVGEGADYLGHRYLRESSQGAAFALPASIRVIALRPDMLVGPAHNARIKDDRRRWDGSDYEMVRFTRDDYRTLSQNGITCVNADDEQSAWADELGLFYWGGGKSLPFPEMLYRSQYLGPAIFFDEPAVHTRDYVLRPRLAKDEAFRKSIQPADALAAFQKQYAETLEKGAPTALARLLAGRGIDTGSLPLKQQNLYSWETMVSTATYQLSRDPVAPEAFVFEPPGRVGARRTIPEWNMEFGTQLPYDDPRALTSILFSFLRGAARASGKNWGVSIYGAVDRADAFYWLTHAYDMGATRFHFWDNYQLACVPFSEYLALARHLRDHAASHPLRDLGRLRNSAEVAITLPAGYDLGHTHMGRGNLWGLGELNLERTNAVGVKFRDVMANYLLEAERLFREGTSFDSLWALPEAAPKGYREVIPIREDGKPVRPSQQNNGLPPRLSVDLKMQDQPSQVTAVATVIETTAPVYYTHGTDSTGVYQNAMVLWELYGPAAEDYRFIQPEGLRPNVSRSGNRAQVTVTFPLERRGTYRLRAAVVDTVGRRTVVWKQIDY